MIVEFLEVTYSRYGTFKLLCDTSLELARSSPTRRYAGLLKGQSQLVKGRPIHSNDCGKYSLCQLDHAQQRKSDTLYFRHKFIF